MQNFLAKAVVVAMLVGGFSLTGDLGWVAEKGQRIVGAADVPEGFDNSVAFTPLADEPAEPGQAPFVHASEGLPETEPVHGSRPEGGGPHSMASSPAPKRPEVTTPGRESGGPEPVGAAFKPHVGGPSEIAWATLGTGTRVVAWLAGPPFRCLVLDFVDPSTGEALLYEVAMVDAGGRPLATAGPPRRVIVGRDEDGRPRGSAIVRGGLIHIAQTGIASHAAGQWLGPVVALARGDQ